MMATATVIATGITPTLITATCLFLPTASGGDFTRGITILTTLTAPILRITTTIPTAPMTIRPTATIITPRTHIVTTAAMLPQLKVATQVSAPSSRSGQNLGTTAARSTDLLETKTSPLSPVIRSRMPRVQGGQLRQRG